MAREVLKGSNRAAGLSIKSEGHDPIRAGHIDDSGLDSLSNHSL